MLQTTYSVLTISVRAIFAAAAAFVATLAAMATVAPARAENLAPKWAKQGAYVYRVSTPDAPNVLPHVELGTALTANLLDKSIPQILILNGILGHDHPGPWNWDGVWPYWNRVTFRANHDWDALAQAMERSRRESNVFWSFHVNLTDVNVGLKDYPETREFFDRLVQAKAIYRRDRNKETNRRDGEPFVPQEIPNDASQQNPVAIFALVNYQRFWQSGLAKQMIDQFYDRLPYAPPVLYLDVLNLAGGNFNTGYPDGPLGGSRETQLDGAIAIIDYLRSKGTDLGTEGPRPEFGDRAGYVWLHGPGFSSDDYRVISGGSWQLAAQHVLGGAGAFNLSPIAVTDAGIANAREHYAALLAGKLGSLPTAGTETWHLAYRADVKDQYDIPGTGDPFRGHWADLVNNFYLVTIQELYHIGKGNTRTTVKLNSGRIHLGKYVIADDQGASVTVSIPDFVATWQGEGARRTGSIMLELPLCTKVTVPQAGRYTMRVQYRTGGRDSGGLNVYLNGALFQSVEKLDVTSPSEFREVSVGELALNAGENEIAFDIGPIRATWSDGTVAQWKTPYLRKGFTVSNGDVVFAEDYDRMWPDTWSGQEKIYFFSWDGTDRAWKLPNDWRSLKSVTIYPLTPSGRGPGTALPLHEGSIRPKLLAQVPYVAEKRR